MEGGRAFGQASTINPVLVKLHVNLLLLHSVVVEQTALTLTVLWSGGCAPHIASWSGCGLVSAKTNHRPAACCLLLAGAVGAHHGRWHWLHSADLQPQQPVPAQGVDHGESWMTGCSWSDHLG